MTRRERNDAKKDARQAADRAAYRLQCQVERMYQLGIEPQKAAGTLQLAASFVTELYALFDRRYRAISREIRTLTRSDRNTVARETGARIVDDPQAGNPYDRKYSRTALMSSLDPYGYPA